MPSLAGRDPAQLQEMIADVSERLGVAHDVLLQRLRRQPALLLQLRQGYAADIVGWAKFLGTGQRQESGGMGVTFHALDRRNSYAMGG